MDRRDSLKSLVIGAAGGAALLSGCKPVSEHELEQSSVATNEYMATRTPHERTILEKRIAENYLNDHERETIGMLSDIILPSDEHGPAASEVDVVGFIDFIVKDLSYMQLPLRGGLMWLDQISIKLFELPFIAISHSQRLQIIENIAYPDKANPDMQYGVKFFELMRNLTVSGYYTTQQGIKSLGYIGNVPNVWDGVPAEVLAEHDVDYDPVWLAKCVDQEKRETIAEWDDQGNLIS